MTAAVPRLVEPADASRGADRIYRFIVIGAGSAGCVLANRLSADPANRVLLLEAGGRDLNPLIHMPAGIAMLVNNRRIKWDYYTEPQPHLHGRRLYWPRGKVLGGSSSINAMCYVRGQPEDYDGWACAGNPEWAFAAVLPYFRKAEDQGRGASQYHGTGGPLAVQDLRHRSSLSETFVQAGLSLGLPSNDDFNGISQHGIGFYQVTQRGGRRCSAATAYLTEARERRNLTIATHTLVERIVLDRARAVGVQYRKGGRPCISYCDGEVLLCAGSINSPQILMLSGIGDHRHLKELGIPVLLDSPGVGENLQDHLDICTLYNSSKRVTYDFGTLGRAGVALQYWSTRRGPGTSNIAEAGGFLLSPKASGTRPDIQLHFVPALLDDHGRNRLPGSGFTLHACFLQPRSRGRIRLRSASPTEAPLIQANYLEHGHDLEVMVDAVTISREILQAAPFDEFRERELFPGSAVNTRAQVAEFIRRKAESIYHPAGTCRMGCDSLAVVDAQLRVRGIERLRVVDASIMPTLVSGNTNAPVVMIAEKAADMLLEAQARPAVHP